MQAEEKRIMVPPETNVSTTNDSENFYTKLTELLDSSGLSLVFNVRETSLNLYLLYLDVTRRGGYHQVGQDKKWGEVASALKLESCNAKLPEQVEMLYAHLLYDFEQLHFFRRPAKQASTKGPLKRKPYLSKLMDKEAVQRVTICKDSSSQMTGKAGYVEQPVLPPRPAPPKELQPAPSTVKERKRRVGNPMGLRNPYHIFLKQECARLKACSQTLDGTNIRQMATDAWNKLSEIEKQPYVEESKKNKEKLKQAAEAMITYNKPKNAQDMKQENRPSQCGDYYCVTSQPEADNNSHMSAELSLALKMTGKVPKECLQQWDTYFALDLPTGESK